MPSATALPSHPGRVRLNHRRDPLTFRPEHLVGACQTVRWVSAQRDVSERARAEASQQMLLDELNHRVMNNLTAAQSLAARIGRSTGTMGEFQDALQQRLFALAQAQKAIVAAHWRSVPLHSLTHAQLAPFGAGDPGRVEASGAQIHLRARAAVVLGLTLHEPGLNALKHGALATPGARVELGWFVVPGSNGNNLCVDWSEEGGAAVKPPTHRGFGRRLIEEVLVRELRGRARMIFHTAGLRCLIKVPLAGILERRA